MLVYNRSLCGGNFRGVLLRHKRTPFTVQKASSQTSRGQLLQRVVYQCVWHVWLCRSTAADGVGRM